MGYIIHKNPIGGIISYTVTFVTLNNSNDQSKTILIPWFMDNIIWGFTIYNLQSLIVM